MKKIIFLAIGLSAALSMRAGNYQESSDGKSYVYTGTPVESFSVDFKTWGTDSLPSTWGDTAKVTEAGNIGFVKWKIANRTLKHEGVSISGGVNCAFNNGTTDDTPGIKNNASTNKPRIYLPTTTRGVKAIKAVMSCNNARTLMVNYKDDNHDTWTYTSENALTAGAGYADTESVVTLNTTGQTSIYLEYASTDYFGVVSISLEMESEVADTTVRLSKDSIVLPVGGSDVLSATVEPADAVVEWVSQYDSVATVANGMVTAVSAGITEIYAIVGSKRDTCVVTVSADPTALYVLKSDGYYHYTGDAVKTVAVDFSNLQPTDILYSEGTTHKDGLMDFQGLGMYKWCYLAQREVAGTNVYYGPLAWNNGTSENGTNNAIGGTQPEKLPAIYFPEIEGGVRYIVVEGWTYNQNRMLYLMSEDASGNMVDYKADGTSVGVMLKKNEYTRDTIWVENAEVKRIALRRPNNNEYQFICNVQVISMSDAGLPIAVDSIKLDAKTLDMEVSQTATLHAKLYPFNATNQEVVWSSSNTAVASVADGVVKALKAGQTIITASCDGKSDSCAVTISGEIVVESITLDQTSLQLAEGKYAKLSATVLPADASNPTVTWTSSNEKVVTVMDGLLYGVSEGTATITAQAGEQTATCQVVVEWVMPEATDYQLVEYYTDCYFYEWYGELQTEGFEIDFTQWTYDSLPDPAWPDFATTLANGHSDELVQRHNLGFYQWTIYEGRDLSTDGYMGSSNVLFNSGYTYLDGTKTGAGVIALSKRPAIYFPTFKNGIKQIRITGVSHNNARSMFVLYKSSMSDAQGNDSIIMAGLPALEFGKEWDEYVIDNQSEAVTDVHIARNSTDYWFIGKIEVIPFPSTSVDAVQDTRYEVRGVHGNIVINAKEDAEVTIYTASGVALQTVKVHAGERVVIPMPQGFYVANHSKVGVK